MVDGIEPAHARHAIEKRADHRQPDIGKADIGRDIADLRQELAGPVRAFEIEQLHAADAQLRQDRDRGDDDTHAADPVQDRPPEQQAARHVFEPGENRRASGRHAGDAFKEGVRDGVARHQERQRTDGVDHDPDADREKEGFALPDAEVAAARHDPEEAANDRGDRGGDRKHVGHAVPVRDVDQRARDHRRCDQQDHYSQRVDDRPELHARAPYAANPAKVSMGRWRSRLVQVDPAQASRLQRRKLFHLKPFSSRADVRSPLFRRP